MIFATAKVISAAAKMIFANAKMVFATAKMVSAPAKIISAMTLKSNLWIKLDNAEKRFAVDGLPDGNGKHGEGLCKAAVPDLECTAGTEVEK